MKLENNAKNIANTIIKIARHEVRRCLDCRELLYGNMKKCPLCDSDDNEIVSLKDYLVVESVSFDYIVSLTGNLKRAEITFNKLFTVKLYSDSGRIIEETSGLIVALPDDVTATIQEAVKLLAPSSIF